MGILIVIILFVPFARCVLRVENLNQNVPILFILNNVWFLNLFFPLDWVNWTQEAINFLLRLTSNVEMVQNYSAKKKKNRFYVLQPIEDFLKGVIECNCKVQKSIVCFLLPISLSLEKKISILEILRRDKAVF